MMPVRMVRSRTWQDQGQERILNAGEVYLLPIVVAAAFLATGAAVHVPDGDEALLRERAVIARAPETKGRAR